MRLRTEINCPSSLLKIGHRDSTLLIGSCFSVEIGGLMQKHCFDASINPFGTIYNIFSIAKLIRRSCSGELVNASEIGYNETTGLYYHFDFHSSFSAIDSQAVVDKCNNALMHVKKLLEETKVVIITLGTSYIHTHDQHGIVSNCHKISGSAFEKRLLSIQEQHVLIDQLMVDINSLNSNVEIIFTVSPVRHIKEGLANNQLSKAYLRAAIESVQQKYQTCHYFPSYEAVMDDLRDYRFYKADLIHPNDQAVRYIWDLFSKTYFEKETIHINATIQKLIQSASHRPLNSNTKAYLKHRADTTQKILAFDLKHPGLNLMTYIKRSIDPTL